jgi:hypothetical protein
MQREIVDIIQKIDPLSASSNNPFFPEAALV